MIENKEKKLVKEVEVPMAKKARTQRKAPIMTKRKLSPHKVEEQDVTLAEMREDVPKVVTEK